MLQIYSIVHNYTVTNLNSQAYITKTYHEGKPLPLGTFVLKRNFTHALFSDKLKPLCIGPYKILDRLSDVTYELFSQYGTFHIHRKTLHLIIQLIKLVTLIHLIFVFVIQLTALLFLHPMIHLTQNSSLFSFQPPKF